MQLQERLAGVMSGVAGGKDVGTYDQGPRKQRTGGTNGGWREGVCGLRSPRAACTHGAVAMEVPAPTPCARPHTQPIPCPPLPPTRAHAHAHTYTTCAASTILAGDRDSMLRQIEALKAARQETEHLRQEAHSLRDELSAQVRGCVGVGVGVDWRDVCGASGARQ